MRVGSSTNTRRRRIRAVVRSQGLRLGQVLELRSGPVLQDVRHTTLSLETVVRAAGLSGGRLLRCLPGFREVRLRDTHTCVAGMQYLANIEHASNAEDWTRPPIKEAASACILGPKNDAWQYRHGQREQVVAGGAV